MVDPIQDDLEKHGHGSEKKQIPEKSADTALGEVEDLTSNIDPAMERRMLWKFDLHVLPLLAMMYLFKYVSLLIHSWLHTIDKW